MLTEMMGDLPLLIDNYVNSAPRSPVEVDAQRLAAALEAAQAQNAELVAALLDAAQKWIAPHVASGGTLVGFSIETLSKINAALSSIEMHMRDDREQKRADDN